MGELAALGSSFVWACASILFAKLGRSLSGLSMNLLKCAISLLFFIPTLLLLEGTFWPQGVTGTGLSLLAISGIVGLSVGDTAYFGSLIRLGPRKALLLTTLVPPVTATLGWAFLGEPLTAPMIAGMALTLAGVTWVVQERTPSDDPEDEGASKLDLIGIGLGVIAALGQATGSYLTKAAPIDTAAMGMGGAGEALAVSIVRLVFGVAGLAIVVAAMGRTRELARPFRSRRETTYLLAATFLGTYLGIWLMNYGFLNAYIGVAATLNSTSPIFVLPLAAIFLDDKLTSRSVVGALIAVSGIAVLKFLG